MKAADGWAALSEPWRRCLDEAWASWKCGSAGVGAVVCDADGRIVVAERNRRLDTDPLPNRLTGCNIAHAEMNALAALPTGTYRDHVLYTSFEPCLMCATAIMMTGIGTVAYAASDPVFDGLHDWLGELSWAADRRPVRTTLGGPYGAFAHVLHLSWLAFWQAPDRVLEPHRRLHGRHLDVAAAVVETGHLAAVAERDGDVVAAADSLWSQLVELAE